MVPFEPTVGSDAFVTVLAPELDSLLCSTYLGGSGNDRAQSIATKPIAVSDPESFYVTGVTDSADFPVTAANALQPVMAPTTPGQGEGDAFLVKMLDLTCSTVEYGSYHGGNSFDMMWDMVLNPGNDYVYLGGQTGSTNLPTTSGAAQLATGGGIDATVGVFNIDSAQLFHADYNTDIAGNDPSLSPPGVPSGDIAILSIAGGTAPGGDFIEVKSGLVFPDNAVQMQYTGTTGNNLIYRAVPDPVYAPFDSGIYTIRWDVAALQDTSSTGRLSASTPTGLAFLASYSGTQLEVAHSPTPVIVPVTPDVAQHMELRLDTANRVYDFFVDDNLVLTAAPFRVNSSPSPNNFSFAIEAGFDLGDPEDYVFDNVSILREGSISAVPDFDNDHIPDSYDTDDDNDGVLDVDDAFPFDPTEASIPTRRNRQQHRYRR